MTDEKKKRRRPISFRPHKGREDELYERAKASGQTVNAYLNARAFGVPVRSRKQAQDAARKLIPAAALADKLHEIALLGDGRIALLVDACFEDLDQLRGELFDDMGRKS